MPPPAALPAEGVTRYILDSRMVTINAGSSETKGATTVNMDTFRTSAADSARGYSREAFYFFLEHAGFATPGREDSAASLAKAERQLAERRWTVQWSPDPEPYQMGGAETRMPETVEIAALYTEDGAEHNGRPLAELCSIGDATPEYRRVVAAELAAQALAALESPDACEMMGGGECIAKAEWLVSHAGQTCTLHLLPMIEFARDFISDELPDIAAADRVTVLVRQMPCARFTGSEVRAAAGVARNAGGVPASGSGMTILQAIVFALEELRQGHEDVMRSESVTIDAEAPMYRDAITTLDELRAALLASEGTPR